MTTLLTEQEKADLEGLSRAEARALRAEIKARRALDEVRLQAEVVAAVEATLLGERGALEHSIRRARKFHTLRAIAEVAGVTHETVRMISLGRSWPSQANGKA